MMEQKKADTQYEVLPEIKNRWSPRAFGERAVEEEKLLALLEAARWAASSNNEQPWRFFIARKGEEAYELLFKGLNQWNQKWAWTAPVLGVSLAKKHFTKSGKENRHAWHDVGLAMGNLSAQATATGLHLHQMAGIEQAYLHEALHIPEDQFDVVSMFALGYQDETRLKELDERYQEAEHSARKRKHMEELIFDNRFGSTPSWIETL